jgi:hypothetical protein
VLRADGVTKSTTTVVLQVSDLALEALVGAPKELSKQAPARLLRAVRLYLSDKDSGRPGWPYPDFLREKEISEVKLELAIDRDLLRALEAEAGRQKVSVSRMAGHAALYYAAELDAGRLTERIADDLEGGEGGDAQAD